MGTDAAGRRQYLYHPDWRIRRDEAKFPSRHGRGHAAHGTTQGGMPTSAHRVCRSERAAAIAVRLLDLGYFRIGNDAYADANGSFGLTTLQRQHVRRKGSTLVFQFVGKSGIEHTITIGTPTSSRRSGC